MRRAFLVFPLVLAACGPNFPTSLFESDDEGWTLAGNGTSTRPELLAQGGNPAGHLCGTDAEDGDIWYFSAPAKYLGNQSERYGKRLTFDLKQSAQYLLFTTPRDIMMQGSGLAIAWSFGGTDKLPGTDWQPFSIRLDDRSGWVYDQRDGKGDPVTEQDFRALLGELTLLRIRGEYYDGPNDRACLDNVYFGRE